MKHIMTPGRLLSTLMFLLLAATGLAATGPFSLTNGYFSIAGDNGLITSVRLDATGQGSYGTNTIANGGHLGFVVDDKLFAPNDARITINGNTLQIDNLPTTTTTVTVRLNLDILTMTLNFTGGGNRTVRPEWDLPYLDAGYYQRKTGMNYDTSVLPVTPVALDMPFESFYNTANANFRPVEIFKKSVEWASKTGLGPREDTAWSHTYCRGRVANDVKLSCAQANNSAVTMSFLPAADRLTLLYEVAAPTGLTLKLQVTPKSYSIMLDGNRPLPEFYVLPEQKIPALYDAGNVQENASDLLTEFFQHSVFWWNSGGYDGGIWSDWSMMPGCFMGSGNPHTDMTKASLAGWVIGDDGYGHPGYAYTWGTERGWPFPADKDSRHFDTNAIFITALWRYVIWTGDTAFLRGGTGDRHTTIGYSDNSNETIPNGGSPAMLTAGSTLGQTFTAKKSFNRVGAANPTWTSTTSGCKLSLYTWPGRQLIKSQTFTNCADNATNYVTISPAQPAGQYYLEMSDPVGTIGWWSSTSDVYSGGVDVNNGVANQSMIAKARDLMTYQQQTLLGAQQNLLVLGPNIGSSDHLGRGGLDVGCHYYDILPFGYKDNMINITYYQSVRAMADLEALMGNTAAAQTYRNQLQQVRKTYNDTFWRTGLDRDQSARYIGTVDVNGTDHDFGYSFLSTMALSAGLADDYPGRAASVFKWLDTGESQHASWMRDNTVQIGYADGKSELIPDPAGNDNYPKQLVPGATLGQVFFATAPFTSVASYNPTWSTTNSGFKLTLYDHPTRRKIAEKTFSNVKDNSTNVLTFLAQPDGFYYLEMSNPVGTVGWWSGMWTPDIYRRWVFAPRSSTRSNVSWWVYPIGDAGAQGAAYQWDDQLQNGGSDLYESGFDVIARARCLGGDRAWDRLKLLLRRYSDPDKLCTRLSGFYGEAIQGGRAGSVGWMFSEFPETAVLGSSFIHGFFGAEPSLDGLMLTPHVPTGRGITAIGARNIWYQGAMFNLEATSSTLKVTCRSNPKNQTFYMTGKLQGSGQFTQSVPLVGGAAVLSTKPQGATPRNEASQWSAYE